MGIRKKAALFAATLMTVASALGAVMLVGREVRAVELITLFAGGFGAGASLVAASVAVRSAGARNVAAEVKEPEELSEQG